jgi:hypothetical protein
MLCKKATTKINNPTMVGQIKSQKITIDTRANGERISKSASHLLQRTFLLRPALRNITAKMPPRRNIGQLNEPLISTVRVKSSAAPQAGQITLTTGAPITALCDSVGRLRVLPSRGHTTASSGFCPPQYGQDFILSTANAEPKELSAAAPANC